MGLPNSSNPIVSLPGAATFAGFYPVAATSLQGNAELASGAGQRARAEATKLAWAENLDFQSSGKVDLGQTVFAGTLTGFSEALYCTAFTVARSLTRGKRRVCELLCRAAF